MRIHTAQLQREAGGDDRVFELDDAVVVLDGASSFCPTPVSASVYADHLGKNLADILRRPGGTDLSAVLRESIATVAGELGLAPGESPSSTVTVLRAVGDQLDVLTLGDNLVAFPDRVVLDDRLAQVGREQRQEYRQRLTAGAGYDGHHRELLHELQHEEAAHRNREDGFWIAEAAPAAADHSVTLTRPLAATPWAVIATDGAYEPMRHLGLAAWPQLADADDEGLAAILQRCQRWESDTDPDGRSLPRAKVHDDKTLVAVRLP